MNDPKCFICTPALCIHGEQADGELVEIDRRVAAAVKAEREACAKLVDLWPAVGSTSDIAHSCWAIAAAIRARGAAAEEAVPK